MDAHLPDDPNFPSTDDLDTDEAKNIPPEHLENSMNDGCGEEYLSQFLDTLFINTTPDTPCLDPNQLDLIRKERLDLEQYLVDDEEELAKVSKVELNPREYQFELFQLALKENIIAVLHTGSGKTLISVMLIKQFIIQEKMDRMQRIKTKISFFLVDRVPLVFQQASVISANSDANVQKLCGQMNVDGWSEDTWKKVYEEADVCVMTAQIFLDSLRQGFVHMDRVNLIIFDECHHATKNHPYNVIMREFYDTCRAGDKPRIFGMTASPMHSKAGVIYSSTQLEHNLCSKVYTATKIDEINAVLNRPMELAIEYAPPIHFTDTHLTSLIISRLGHDKAYKFLYARVESVLNELGPWCCDAIWKLLLKELHCKADIPLHQDQTTDLGMPEYPVLVTDKVLEDCISMIERHVVSKPAIDQTNFSPKVLKLLLILRTLSSKAHAFVGIILVENRHTAFALRMVIQAIDELAGFNVGILVGHGSNEYGDVTMVYKEQNRTIDDFRNGKINLLIATSVAEEGLDIQPCNLVIRFDFMMTPISYIQSRGRARQKDSKFIIFMQHGNYNQKSSLHKYHVLEEQMNIFCQTMPEERNVALRFLNEHQDGIHTDDRSFNPDEDSHELHLEDAYVVQKTGAMVTKQSAVALLIRYCSCLPHDPYSDSKPSFEIQTVSGSGYKSFVCIIHMPGNAAVRLVTSKAASSKTQAKKLAALDCVRQLHDRGALTDYLLPVNYRKEVIGGLESVKDENGLVVGSRRRQGRYEKRAPQLWKRPLPSMDCQGNLVCEWLGTGDPQDVYERQKKSVQPNGNNAHDPFADLTMAMRTTAISFAPADRPDVIDSHVDERPPLKYVPAEDEVPLEDMAGPFYLWATLLHLDIPQVKGISLRSLCLLTWRRFPSISPLAFHNQDTLFHAITVPVSDAPIQLSKENLAALKEHNLLLSSAITNRSFTCALGQFPYFLAPLKRSWDPTAVSSSSLLAADLHAAIDWSEVRQSAKNEPTPVTWQHGSNLDDAIIVDYGDNGRRYFVSEVCYHLTPSSPVDKALAMREVNDATVADYYERKFSFKVKDPHQPLLRVLKTGKALNYLTPHQMMDAQTRKTTAVFVIPEFCQRYATPASTYQTWLLIPSIMTRVDALLLSLDARSRFNLDISDNFMLEAFTTPSASMGTDYERLETLGDSLLKFISTIRLYINFPFADEGKLHYSRIKVICNRSLYRAAKRLKLYRYVTSIAFNRRDWRPHGYTASDDSSDFYNRTLHHTLSDKCLADVVEASLGAAYLSGGLEAGLHCAIAMQVPFDEMRVWADFWPTYLASHRSAPPRVEMLAHRKVNMVKIQELCNYEFQNPLLVEEALTHASLLHSNTPCYQRLEFLGDAILDFLVIRYLFKTYPGAKPGLLTDLKDSCVNNRILGIICFENNLHRHIIHYSTAMIRDIEAQQREVQAIKDRGEDKAEYWLDLNLPKVLSDVVESMLGAVFVDAKFNLDTAQALFDRWFVPIIEAHISPHTLQVHPVNKMISAFQQNGCDNFLLRNIGIGAPGQDISKSFTCVVFLHGKPFASGCSDNFKAARREAAGSALARLDDDPDLLDRICDCGIHREHELAKKRDRSAMDYDADSDGDWDS
ncbi:hypothetical protein DM01DRAFT_1335102 [Hesseltinella vesiculosa]|uniref:Dicer-like protein 1 n=1 Tax=Hesseltinella vesiculosa TaxID=101127 RepID=A0A1X2GK20_9FUNG|nr:hypothetical protein DM01DRAFT_1335102 [Hesseltinella vesiculosa]